MSEAFGAILKFLGAILNGIYGVIPQYGVAIILLTIVVRVFLFPLAVKQIKSMTAMQRIQPKLREIQKKHKGDRQKLNEEMMKLYREHGVNPLGGCFPMLLQLPVFIALYAVIRSAVPFTADVEPTALTIPITKATVCRPDGAAPSGDGAGFSQVKCTTDGKSQVFAIAEGSVFEGKNSANKIQALPSYVVHCTPVTTKSGDETTLAQMRCTSPLGTGHLPKDGKLFKALVQDRGTFLGMHLACSPTQASSKKAIQACTADKQAGGGIALASYYGLVLLMAGTTFYQQKQLLSRQSKDSPQAAQMQMMAKIMPVFMGFLSLNFPAALSLYWVVGNFWMIGQQHFVLQAQDAAGAIDVQATDQPPTKSKPKPMQSGNGRPGERKSKRGKQGKKR